jgi:hypothetical protein
MKKAINIHNFIHYRYDGVWVAKYKDFSYESMFWDKAINKFLDYLYASALDVNPWDEDKWTLYYNECQYHIDYMLSKKDTMTESAWQMDFSCSAPNKPGYEFANND